MEPGLATAAAIALDAVRDLAIDVLPDVQILDGPPGAQDVKDDVFIVGWSLGMTPSVIVDRPDPPDPGGRQREEGDVVCVVDCYSGDRDFTALRERATTILTLFAAALRDRPGVDGALDGGWLGDSMEWTQVDTEDGCTVRLAFSVHYVAEL